MLFPYPVAAAATNWLHDTLADVVRCGMDNIDAGLPPADWPACLPAERRARLGRFTQLQDRLRDLLAGYALLAPGARARVRAVIDDQGALQELFDGRRLAARNGDLPEEIRGPAQLLYAKAFEMLAAVGIRDENYRRFAQMVEHRVCAFCGCEYFSGPGPKREPLDHYLAISLYAFAGANARNLVPMGGRCNSSYKLAQDILRDRTGARRVCFDPYAATPVRVSLMRTRLFARDSGLPEWVVDLEGDVDRIATWDDVFAVKSRYATDHLDSIYKNTFRVFARLWRKRPSALGGGGTVCDALAHLGDLSRPKGWSDRAFLETAVYELVHARCTAGGPEADRLVAEYSDAKWAAA